MGNFNHRPTGTDICNGENLKVSYQSLCVRRMHFFKRLLVKKLSIYVKFKQKVICFDIVDLKIYNCLNYTLLPKYATCNNVQ